VRRTRGELQQIQSLLLSAQNPSWCHVEGKLNIPS
jgi:hypothetical protein